MNKLKKKYQKNLKKQNLSPSAFKKKSLSCSVNKYLWLKVKSETHGLFGRKGGVWDLVNKHLWIQHHNPLISLDLKLFSTKANECTVHTFPLFLVDISMGLHDLALKVACGIISMSLGRSSSDTRL